MGVGMGVGLGVGMGVAAAYHPPIIVGSYGAPMIGGYMTPVHTSYVGYGFGSFLLYSICCPLCLLILIIFLV